MISAAKICHPVPFLNAVNIDVKPGVITGIIGPNGAGKTTLLKMLTGLMKPKSGQILLDDVPVLEIPYAQRALRIAYLEQHAFVHWPLSVRQLIELGRFPHRRNPDNSPAIDKQVTDKVIEQVGISELLERQFNTLSGGERARIIIARAIAVQADYLLVDEPIASLDLNFQLDVMNILARQAGQGTAVCVILHDLNLAAAFCERLYLLNKGEVVAQGSAQQVLNQEQIKNVFGIDARVSNRNGQVEVYPQLPQINRN